MTGCVKLGTRETEVIGVALGQGNRISNNLIRPSGESRSPATQKSVHLQRNNQLWPLDSRFRGNDGYVEPEMRLP